MNDRTLTDPEKAEARDPSVPQRVAGGATVDGKGVAPDAETTQGSATPESRAKGGAFDQVYKQMVDLVYGGQFRRKGRGGGNPSEDS